MICPHCLKTVPDDVDFCPNCHAYLGVSRSVSRDDFVYCEGCGARLSPHDRTCPKCGRPAPGILSTKSAALDLAAGKTASFPRLTRRMIEREGAPREQASSAARVAVDAVDPAVTSVLSPRDVEKASRAASAASEVAEDPYHKPRNRFVRPLAAVALACGLVGGCYYFVTSDPLGVMPGAYAWFESSAREMFPSRQRTAGSAVDDASGSSKAAAADDVLTEREAYQKLMACYQRIIESHDAIDGIVEDYNASYLASNRDTRVSASGSAYAARDKLDAVVSELGSIKLASGSAYTDEVKDLTQLAQWVRVRVDMYCASWDISLSYEGDDLPRRHKAEILAPLRERASDDAKARTSYYANVEAFRPAAPAA